MHRSSCGAANIKQKGRVPNMYTKKECVAMLLAGGQGSRLYALTRRIAKPAVPFGGRYRIIDFPLSNCTNSGIDTVGVLTQYEHRALHAYIGSGLPWDLDRNNGGVHLLPPYMSNHDSQWYKGTANAIYQNIPFLDQYNPEYVLILSGDHIYKMDYAAMLAEHKKNLADCTIAVIDVPLSEASRFGILSADESGRITKFAEKPKNPESTLASMGIYIFSWKELRKRLIEDENNPESDNDFGKNIIPTMLGDGARMYVHTFSGYWKDVGTIDSYWEANMDMLAPQSGLNLTDPSWRIYSRTPVSPPQFIADGASVTDTLIADGCCVSGEVEESVLFNDVRVGKGAKVRYSILMPGTVIEDGASVEFAIVAENVTIGRNARVGSSEIDPEGKRITVIGSDQSVAEDTVVEPGSMLG